MSFNIEPIILSGNFRWNFDSVYAKPNIPTKKIMGALTYSNVVPDDILVLIDDTVFGGAKDGMLITTKGIFAHEPFTDRRFLEWGQIKDVSSNGKELFVNGLGFYKPSIIEKEAINCIARQLKETVDIINGDVEKDSGQTQGKVNNDDRATNSHQQHLDSKKSSAPKHSLSYIQKDAMYEQVKKVRNIGTAFNVASIFLGGKSKENPITAIDETVERAIQKAAIIFREDIVINHGVTEFANDFATIEAMSYATAMIINKLKIRGVPEVVLQTVILDSFQKALFINNLNDTVKNNFTEALLEYVRNDDESMVFFMKLVLGNKKQILIVSLKDHVKDLYDPITQAPLDELQETIKYIEPKFLSAKNKIDQHIDSCVRDVMNIIHA